jgi:hypothetical protein
MRVGSKNESGGTWSDEKGEARGYMPYIRLKSPYRDLFKSTAAGQGSDMDRAK